MPRQKNLRPTVIYWLVDTRPETLAGWPQGKTFYVGKTVEPKRRLGWHLLDAKRRPDRAISIRLRECGEHVRMVVLEKVPPEDCWVTRERYWIARSRELWPGDIVNISDGGEGAPGRIYSAETRKKIGSARRGRSQSAETIEKRRLTSAKTIEKRYLTQWGVRGPQLGEYWARVPGKNSTN